MQAVILPLLIMSIFKDHRVKNLTAGNASPPKKMLTYPVELLVDHDPSAPMAPHITLLNNRLVKMFYQVFAISPHHISVERSRYDTIFDKKT